MPGIVQEICRFMGVRNYPELGFKSDRLHFQFTADTCYTHNLTLLREHDSYNRRQLLERPFSSFEQHARDQLDQALSGAGFDADRDITGITVNRWSHGYSYNPGLLWEPEYASEAGKPWVQGCQPFGRISIANSDAAASASTDAAISQAYRAAREVMQS